jgi:hypothetical protein
MDGWWLEWLMNRKQGNSFLGARMSTDTGASHRIIPNLARTPIPSK